MSKVTKSASKSSAIQSIIAPGQLLTSEQVAEILAIAPHTLSVWRCTGRMKLPWVRVGRAVRYRRNDVEEFISQRTQIPGGEAA